MCFHIYLVLKEAGIDFVLFQINERQREIPQEA